MQRLSIFKDNQFSHQTFKFKHFLLLNCDIRTKAEAITEEQSNEEALENNNGL